MSAKALLKLKNLEFTEKSVEDLSIREELLNKLPTAKQLPQIFIDDKSVGSLAGLQSALKQMNV